MSKMANENDKEQKQGQNEVNVGALIEELLKEKDIADLRLTKEDILNKIEDYEKEFEKHAIWYNKITENFKKYLKGEKVYDRDKERISFYVADEKKEKWKDFIEQKNISSISKLIRQAVDHYIASEENQTTKNFTPKEFSSLGEISHALKEPLTTIKGFSQLLLETFQEELSEEILNPIENIFEQSLLLENKIKNILEDTNLEEKPIDILLIEDDLPTIRLLTKFFEKKNYICVGANTAMKAFEILSKTTPQIILVDVLLPDKSGYEICKEIKNNPQLRKVHVFFLTALPQTDIEKKMEETKADGYILKPFDFSDFEKIFKYIK